MTVLLNIPIYKMSPSVFGKLASALNEVAPYVGNISRQSYAAEKHGIIIKEKYQKRLLIN